MQAVYTELKEKYKFEIGDFIEQDFLYNETGKAREINQGNIWYHSNLSEKFWKAYQEHEAKVSSKTKKIKATHFKIAMLLDAN